MQQQSQTSSKLPVILTVIIIVVSLGYYFYSNSGTTTGSDSALTLANSSPTVGTEVLTLLNQIHSLKIDTAFFKSPVYESLIDFSVVIPPEPVGKPSPFVPF